MKTVSIKDFFEDPDKYVKPRGRVFLIGVAGGSGSGKTFVANQIVQKFNGALLSTDNYYVGRANMKDDNYDHPDAVDLNLLSKNLEDLKKGKSINLPLYSFITHSRTGYQDFVPSKVIVLEGIFALDKRFAKSLDLRIFVGVSEEIMLARRTARDIEERGRTKENVLEQWRQTVWPMYQQFVYTQKENADLIIDSSEDLKVNLSQ